MKAAAVLSAFALLALGAAQAQSDSRRADPPGEETPETAKLIDEAAARMGTREELEKTLRDPKYMAAHAYPRFREAVERNAPVGKLEYAGPSEPGEPLTVRLELKDPAEKPLANVGRGLGRCPPRGRSRPPAVSFALSGVQVLCGSSTATSAGRALRCGDHTVGHVVPWVAVEVWVAHDSSARRHVEMGGQASCRQRTVTRRATAASAKRGSV